jgi:hypothetical protein
MLPLILQPPPKAPVVTSPYATKVLAVNRSHLVAYWPLWEGAGSIAVDLNGNPRSGAYSAVTLEATGAGDGRTAASFNGTTSICNIYSAAFAGAFNGAAGTMAIWAKMAGAGNWTDGLNHYLFAVGFSGAHSVRLFKTTVNGNLNCSYIANSITKAVTIASGSPAGWYHLAITWDKAADQMKAYLNGVQSGVTQTGLGVWSGTPISTQCIVGGLTTTLSNLFAGTLAHAAVWDVALSAANITTLATVP